MKKFFYLILTFLITLSFASCSNNKKTISSDNTDSDISQQQSNPMDDEPKAEELTLEDAEVRLIYIEDNYIAFAYHGPTEDVGMHFCQKDGEELHTEVWLTFIKMNPGWKFVYTNELPDGYTIDNLSLSVTDYAANDNPKILLTDFGEAMTNDELKEVGFGFVEGRCFALKRPVLRSYGKDNFNFSLSLIWVGKDYIDFVKKNIDIENIEEIFQFYTDDDHHLEEHFKEYTFKMTQYGSNVCTIIEVWFYQNDSGDNKVRHKQMCDELKECKSYMICTNTDGESKRFVLFQD